MLRFDAVTVLQKKKIGWYFESKFESQILDTLIIFYKERLKILYSRREF